MVASGPDLLAAAAAVGDRALARLGAVSGAPVGLDPAPNDAADLIAERAVRLGHEPTGPVSAGGSCHLLPSADGWVAANLPRVDDIELVPAWLGVTATAGNGLVDWEQVAEAVAARSGAEVVEQGQLLGLAVAVVPMSDEARRVGDEQLVSRDMVGGRRPLLGRRLASPTDRAPDLRVPLVVDLSSLWAGPLCGRLLAAAGMRVVKVESSSRLDGARGGDPGFFHALNGAKEHRALPLATDAGRNELRHLLSTADIVIEGSRPRALRQMGIQPSEVVGARPGSVWVSITAYGRRGPWSNRVGFGDDTAAAGGLVSVEDGRPAFVGDAIADPLAGMVAAGAAADAWARGGGCLLDVALREVARHTALHAGSTMPVPR